jgi:CRP/FNR family cyclic AMP-dependent transcriptional regulator
VPSPTASHGGSDVVNSQTDPKVAHAMAASPILGLLSPDGRKRLVASGSMVSLEPGAVLCQQGDPGDAIFLLLEGEIEARTASANGHELRFAGYEPPAVVGEMAVLGDGLRATDMIATRRTRLWRIPRAPLIEALHAEPAAAVAMVSELAARLRATSAALEAARTMDLGARLAQLLLAAAGDKTLVPLTQTEIARRLSVSRETVSRKLNKWARLGWVSLATSGVRVLGKSALSDLIENGGTP